MQDRRKQAGHGFFFYLVLSIFVISGPVLSLQQDYAPLRGWSCWHSVLREPGARQLCMVVYLGVD